MDGPSLRLVVDGVVLPPRVDRTRETSSPSKVRREVAHENRDAAAMQRDDARLVFAQRVAANIEGGKAAILRPEVRKRLLTEGASMGLRSFDANLIIAVAQDAAQRGVMTDSRDVLGQLRFVGVPNRGISPLRLLFLAAVLASMVVAGLAAWLAAS
jgi:hypothetical protein